MNKLQTGFLPGPNGRMYLSVLSPEKECTNSPWVIHVPAFGEEMNKSRAMIASQARELADRGMLVLIPDLFGTGDSTGSLSEATWQAWRNEILYLIRWSRTQGADHITLWGHRLGCLLAADVSSTEPPDAMLLWQPVHSGRQHMAQFLRLRVAGGLTSGSGETTAELRERLMQGESLEIGGYTLPGCLFQQIESQTLVKLTPDSNIRVTILEVVSEDCKPVTPITRNLVEQWTQAGVACSAGTATGAPFWMTQELIFLPDLIEKTSTQLGLVNGDSQNYSGVGLNEGNQVCSILDGLTPQSEDGVDAVVFPCGDEQLAGILHQGNGNSALGILVVVGGPQYRVGSHRQFVSLAEYLASHGLPVLRFDYRGMGDSSGSLLGFEHIHLDITSAIDAFQSKDPTINEVVIWGLCDAATAAVFYAASDPRVRGLVLVNPWVYSERGAAKAYLKHYYIQRLFQRGFWQKVFSGKFSVFSSATSAWKLSKNALAGETTGEANRCSTVEPQVVAASVESDNLVLRFTDSLARFKGDVFFILSGKDLTAAEFIDAIHDNRKLGKLMKGKNVSRVTLPEADHTFSRAPWQSELEKLSFDSLKRLISSRG